MNCRNRIIISISLLVAMTACGGGNQKSSTTNKVQSTPQASAQSADAATISGTVKFTGTAPKSKMISMTADAFCKTQHASKVPAENVVVNPNGTLKNVYVYVKSGLGNKDFPIASTPAVLDQKGCIYKPHVLAVQAGQEIIIRNSDGVLHNVNARPKNNKGFNIGQPVQGMENKKKFDNPELAIPVKCDVHPWMGGYIHVQKHPFGSVTDGSGSFSLKGLPPGSYEIEAWHETYGTTTQKVTVGAKESKTIQFSFKGA